MTPSSDSLSSSLSSSSLGTDGQVFKCVKDCAAFMDHHDVKSLYTCYSICLFEVDPDSEDQHPY